MPKWRLSIITGDPRDALNEEAREFGADLIVMCARSKPHPTAWIGSTAKAMCRQAPCPVLVTRQREREWVGLTTNQSDLRKILVGFDFSSQAELALVYGLALARGYQSQLHVAFVRPPHRESACKDEVTCTPAQEKTPDEFLDLLRDYLPAEAQTWCQIKPVVLEGQPAKQLLAYATTQEIDLICMGVHDPGLGMKPLWGSNVDQVLRHLPCPLLAVRPVQSAVPISSEEALEQEPDNYALVH